GPWLRAFWSPVGQAACRRLPLKGTTGWPICDGSDEEQDQSDEQREDAHRFSNGEAEDQTGKLAVCGGGVAEGAGEVVAEDVAHAVGRATHAKAGDSGADELCCVCFHDQVLLLGRLEVRERREAATISLIGVLRPATGLSGPDAARREDTCRSEW